MKKLWGGRFSETTDEMVENFTESISYDKRLYSEDIAGSIAHVKMLKKQKIVSSADANKIIKGLNIIKKEIESAAFEFKKSHEDIHMAIEGRLKELIGEVAGKLHTARSRNDQVATDIRLYLKNQTLNLYKLLRDLQKVFVIKAKAYLDVPVPGYTHLQRAQPVFLSHYLLAFVEMWERDKGRLIDCYRRVDILPLGSGAMSGTTFPLDREFVSQLLNFSEPSRNSMDAVSDRDFAIEFLSALSIIMMHLSRLSEDMILWNSFEFGYVILPDEFCTGSSIMPQKKNPDVLELTRGKTGRVYGDLFALLTIMKGLPLTYNRDMQEDKEPLFDAIDTVTSSLQVLTAMFKKVEFNREKLASEADKGFILATEVADYLAKKGLPFREAHEITGKIVVYCERSKKELNELSLEEFKKFSEKFGKDIFKAIDIKSAISSRNVKGGTGLTAVREAIKFWEKQLEK